MNETELEKDIALEQETHVQEKSAKKPISQTVFNQAFLDFKQSYDLLAKPDDQLKLTLDFMEKALSEGTSPNFRDFWDAKALCLALFKETLSPIIRQSSWSRYQDLSGEAKRLKDILDEEANFAAQQIEIAIAAIEQDSLQFAERVKKSGQAGSIEFPVFLKSKKHDYQQLQEALYLLNQDAAKVNALRKELLKTNMRIGPKNKFFQRLSLLGNQIFPKRKEMIIAISQLFSQDVGTFIQNHFGEEPSNEALFHLREEIKAFQNLAKLLTLNTQSFTETRAALSTCWDKIKSEEKERKKERAELRITFKENAALIQNDVDALKELIESKTVSSQDAFKKIDAIVHKMRQTRLGREEIESLKLATQQLSRQLEERSQSEEAARKAQENEKIRLRAEKLQALKEQALCLVNSNDEIDADELIEKQTSILQQLQESLFSKHEKLEIERHLKPLKDIIADKKEKALLGLSDDDRQILKQLKVILDQRKSRYLEIKEQLNALKKAGSSFGLDFTKALQIDAQVKDEMERRDKAALGIEEIENQINQLQIKIKSSV